MPIVQTPEIIDPLAMSPEHAAAFLSLSRRALSNLIADGAILAKKHGVRTLVDVASVGMPRDGDQRAVYAVLDWEQGAWQIEHRRVAFDIQAVARDYAAVGYPGATQAARRLLKASYG